MVDVHYFAAARAAAGISSERLEPADVPDTLGQLLELLAQRHSGTTESGLGLKEIFPRCSFLLDGAGGADASSSLQAVERVDILPPFAGG